MAGGVFVFENEWIFPISHGPGTLASELSLIGGEKGGGCTVHCPSHRTGTPRSCTSDQAARWRLQDDLDGWMVVTKPLATCPAGGG
ncbi:uncharacterized protein N7496_001729 [Penicillium cataractarum]|uniref:Uncharacterized protein n=1 Tax=Penicillium cataractarum TaxID=2100454 RepID=A0A9W9VWH6_9EURO|nr:uncharacterized protein N7496_001729 [Penicillium cataractarum]KAJ5390661.1 hypothetical protein N7496_001729 [Penicillium cataractarum]